MTLDGRSSTNDVWLSTLLTQALYAHEEERRAITAVLKEDVGQTLTALALQLRLAQNACNNPQCATRITEARTLIGDALRTVEQLTSRLIPPALENQGLGPALEIYAKDFAKNAGIQVELDLEVLSSRATSEVELVLFHIAQDALENIRHHAYASVIRIVLRKVRDQLCLVIEDDGTGYSPEMLSDWGVLWMTQRAKTLGGTCSFQAVPGQGARVTVKLPIVKEAE